VYDGAKVQVADYAAKLANQLGEMCSSADLGDLAFLFRSGRRGEGDFPQAQSRWRARSNSAWRRDASFARERTLTFLRQPNLVLS